MQRVREEKIYYFSTDHIKLCGLLSRVNDGNEMVVLCHGIRGNKDEEGSFVSLTKELQRHGRNSFRFDFRSHGESTGNDFEVTITKEIEDLEMTIEMLMEKGYSQFVLLGASFGAGIASLLDYSKYTNIRALICWYGALDYTWIAESTDSGLFSEKNRKAAEERGSYSSFSKNSGKEFKLGLPLFEETERLTPYENLLNLTIPVLFVHGDQDTLISYELSRQVSAKCKNAKFSLIKGGEHSFVNSGQALNQAIEETMQFIRGL